LVCANTYDGTLMVFTNNGSGAFGFNATLAVSSVNDVGMVIAVDVNGDGKVDLITQNSFANTLSVMTNNGNGGFVLASSPSVGQYPLWITPADINGDGKLDLITANYYANTLTILTNKGGGVFGSNATITVGNHPNSVVAADVNGDGKLDLICANGDDNTLMVFTNNGYGVFGSNAMLNVGKTPISVTAADVNRDGKPDLICANANANTLSVLLNTSVFPSAYLAHTAIGTLTLVSGFVVGVNLVDHGYGYTNTPLVRLIGGGGSGAEAVAIVSNGVVTVVNVLDAGYGYTNAPLVVIEPPFILNPVLGIAPMSFLSFSNLTVGGTYQLQQSLAWYWINQPVSFTATNSLFTQMVAGVWGSGNFRLALNPVPSQAFATPQVVNGFVVGATVTSGGSGYVTSPAVSIVGGHGTNATAVSLISGGVVKSINITDAGLGYTNTPTIQIAAPPAAAVFPAVQPVMRVDSSSLAPYDNYQIQFKPDIVAGWINWDGGLFSPTDVTNSQFLFITNGMGFFRLQYMP
jgi:hypothetical protein